MARVQQQGVNAVTIWMIIFVVLWLASTVTLVVLYTGQEDLRAANESLRRERNKAVSSSQIQSIPVIASASENQTMVGLLEQARASTADLATGDEAALPAEVQTKRDQLLERIRQNGQIAEPRRYVSASYHDALTQLFAEFSSKSALLEEQQARSSELEERVAELTQQKADMKADFEARTAEMGKRLATLEQERATFREDREGQVETLRQTMDERQITADRDLAAERERSAQLEQEIDKLQTRFTDLQRKCGALQMSPDPLAPARTPDGKILVAVPGDPVVYINLGREDRLTLGLEFAVYSAETGIPADGKAKARVEVVSMTASSAECKIVWVDRNAILLAGDLVANPVYDPSRSLTFFVAGEFDLNRDGRPDAGGTETIKAMVREWGGTVQDELTPLTDFAVIGIAPRSPREGDEPFVGERHERYHEALSTARSLSLPMLTQSSFLSFLGYGDAG